MKETTWIAVLDVGTFKVAALIAEVNPDGAVNVLGVGYAPSNGLKKGVVVNIDATAHAIDLALQSAAQAADIEVGEVFVSIAGSHIRSFNSHGTVAIKDQEVTEGDIMRVLETARAVNIANDHRILHVLPQEYIIDNQGDIIEKPIGMSGIRLEVRVHIVTGAISAGQNISRCVQRCGVEVAELVLQPLASSYAILTEDEKELGVCLLDIGGGTTDIAIFMNGAIEYTGIIPIAGSQITNDITVALRTTTAYAELLKCSKGASRVQDIEDELIEAPIIGEKRSRPLHRKEVVHVIQARMEELFSLVRQDIERSSYFDAIPAGIVITGGTASLPGIAALASDVFELPVRIGIPLYQGSHDTQLCQPQFSTVIGLLYYARNKILQEGPERTAFSLRRVGRWIRNWLEDNF
jgi:cell division protein FtsA